MENLLISLYLYALSLYGRDSIEKEAALVNWNKFNQTPYHYIGTVETPRGPIRIITLKPQEI